MDLVSFAIFNEAVNKQAEVNYRDARKAADNKKIVAVHMRKDDYREW